MEIDRASATPPYQQVAEWLRQRAAELEPGDRLPSAVDLAQMFGVAVLTGRRALAVVVEEGTAYRTVGLGTYVAERSS